MSEQDFFAKLVMAVEARDSLLCVGLDPTLAGLPDRYRGSTDEPYANLLRWNKAIIDATADLAAVYKPNIAFYEALGDSGSALLRDTLAYLPTDVPVLLDAKRGDIGSTAAAYAQACFDVWQADAVTLSPYLGRDSVQPFLDYANKGLFLLCHTSNPGATDFQHLEIHDWHTLDRAANDPLYIRVARTVTEWGPNVALVVGATYPDAIEAVRGVAKSAWILVPGVGAQGGALATTVQAGLRDDGMGLIVNASRGIAQAEDPGAAAAQLREAINQARDNNAHTAHRAQNASRANGAMAQQTKHSGDAQQSPHTEFLTDLTLRLVELGALQFGTFTLASGIESPIYIDLRVLVSDPPLLAQVAAAYAQCIEHIQFDRLAGVPYAALPIGTALALHTGRPMIYPRKEAKAYGLGKNIEGNWQAGERVLVVEDLITSGGSLIQSAETLRSAGLVVEDGVVLIDREQGGREKLAAAGIRAHSVFRVHEIIDILETNAAIDSDTAQNVRRFFAESNA